MVAEANNFTGVIRRVLVVEDSPAVAGALAKLLENQGFRAETCPTAGRALASVDEMVPDAAIVDIHLPDSSGLAVAQQLRERMGPSRPIIVMSGDSSMETLKKLGDTGATLFISKPFNATRLMEHLKGCGSS